MKRWVLVAAMLLPVSQAEAAILSGWAQVYGTAINGGAQLSDTDIPEAVYTSEGISTFSASASINQNGAVGAASAHANVKTGEFAVSASAFGIDPTQSAVGASTLSIQEGFNVTGTGTIVLTLALIGKEDVSLLEYGEYGRAYSYTHANLRAGGISDDPKGGSETLNFGQDNYQIGSGHFLTDIDDILSFSVEVEDGELYNFGVDFRMEFVGDGSGLVHGSIMLSSLLSITPSDGVTLTFTDPNFLSNPDAVIPLPASALLLLTGLAGIPLLRRRAARI